MNTHARNIILGTAGHIDHGKSSLVLALTGTDPDRLKEEKNRGITIELGFAQIFLPDETTMGIVDVPGHERFVRQMIAGSTGVDIALLCIAADDGIMPQTEEHLAVLQLLGIKTCVVALTKIDLVDEEWSELVGEEIAERLKATPYANCDIIGVSSRTGAGLDNLKEALMRAVKNTSRSHVVQQMRMPVDRSFTLKGAGTVITGTLWSGEVHLGNEVEILPSGHRTRIRGIQMHGKSTDTAMSGNRVALNLNALSTQDVCPGDFLCTPHSCVPTDRFDAEFSYLGLPDTKKPLTRGTRVHVAHGTREVIGRILPLGIANKNTQINPGETCLVQIRLDEALPVQWQDRFIVRSYSPVHVVGGGTVLRAHPKRTTIISADSKKLLDALIAHDNAGITTAVLELEQLPITAMQLTRISGLDITTAKNQLETLAATPNVIELETHGKEACFITRRHLQKALRNLENKLIQFHSDQPSATGISKENLRMKCAPKASIECWNALLAEALKMGSIVSLGSELCHPSAGASALKAQKKTADRIEALLLDGGATPQQPEDLFKDAKIDRTQGYKVLARLEQQNRIIKINQDIYYTVSTFNNLREATRIILENTQGATVADLKEKLGISRKYAIPLFEYFDKIGFTRRNGDTRTLFDK